MPKESVETLEKKLKDKEEAYRVLKEEAVKLENENRYLRSCQDGIKMYAEENARYQRTIDALIENNNTISSLKKQNFELENKIREQNALIRDQSKKIQEAESKLKELQEPVKEA